VYTVCIARLNVYLPDQLAEAIRPLEWNLSHLLQSAVRERLDNLRLDTWLKELKPDSRGAAVHGRTLAALEPADLEGSNG
jgi:post-segregation antitoxin (ccd killing protein)